MCIRDSDKTTKDIKLFQPEDIYVNNSGSPLDGNKSKGIHPLHGVNPASGVVIYYQLPEVADSIDVTIEIKDAKGQVVNTLTSKKDKSYRRWDGGPPAMDTLSKNAGLNRYVWDTRHSIMPGIPDAYIEASFRGHKAIPGEYSATLKVCLLYTSPSPRDRQKSRMPSSA